MGIFASMEIYIEIKAGWGGKVRVRKLPLGERMEFIVAYDSYVVNPSPHAEYELAARVAVNPPVLLSGKDRRKIISAALRLNSRGNAGGNGGNPGEACLQHVLAYFGREFGYSKDDTMRLYPEEIELMIAENEKMKRADLTLLAGMVHIPRKTLQTLENADRARTDAGLDRRAVDTLKKTQRRR
ncbi:MAG: hypothetical protein HPY53_04835 [Brevinematales bacterium]|nr:hypothetical protein [Brevinematales bacterium]